MSLMEKIVIENNKMLKALCEKYFIYFCQKCDEYTEFEYYNFKKDINAQIWKCNKCNSILYKFKDKK